MPPVAKKRPAAAQSQLDMQPDAQPDAQPAPAGKKAKTKKNPLSPTWGFGKLVSVPSVTDVLDSMGHYFNIPEGAQTLKVVSSFQGLSPLRSFYGKGPAITEVCSAVDTQRACHHHLQNEPAAHIFGKLATIGATECIKHGKDCSPDLGKIDLVLCGGDDEHIRDAAPCLDEMICDLRSCL